MKLDLSALLNKRETALDFSFTLEPASLEDSALLPEEITLSGGICVSGRVSDCDGYFKLDAQVSAEYDTVCDRCLAPLRETVDFPFSRIAVASSADIDKLGLDEDDALFVRDGGLDFDRELMEEFCLELPVYHLCEEDCPGLCDVCGQRLDGSCRCKNEKEIDPRLESFQKLLEKMKKE